MEKQRWEESEKRREEERRSDTRKSQKKEDAGARKGRRVAKHCVFPMTCGSRGSKSRLAKVVGVEPFGQMWDEKLHAVVARSAFPSQNAQCISCSEHLWKFRCSKSACCCGAKHISKSKCAKHTSFGPLFVVEMLKKHMSKSKCRSHLSVGALLEVEMLRKCTPLWREAHVEVKMYKAHHSRTTFGS